MEIVKNIHSVVVKTYRERGSKQVATRIVTFNLTRDAYAPWAVHTAFVACDGTMEYEWGSHCLTLREGAERYAERLKGAGKRAPSWALLEALGCLAAVERW
jgi:hypothetical protein